MDKDKPKLVAAADVVVVDPPPTDRSRRTYLQAASGVSSAGQDQPPSVGNSGAATVVDGSSLPGNNVDSLDAGTAKLVLDTLGALADRPDVKPMLAKFHAASVVQEEELPSVAPNRPLAPPKARDLLNAEGKLARAQQRVTALRSSVSEAEEALEKAKKELEIGLEVVERADNRCCSIRARMPRSACVEPMEGSDSLDHLNALFEEHVSGKLSVDSMRKAFATALATQDVPRESAHASAQASDDGDHMYDDDGFGGLGPSQSIGVTVGNPLPSRARSSSPGLERSQRRRLGRSHSPIGSAAPLGTTGSSTPLRRS